MESTTHGEIVSVKQVLSEMINTDNSPGFWSSDNGRVYVQTTVGLSLPLTGFCNYSSVIMFTDMLVFRDALDWTNYVYLTSIILV